MIPEPDMSNCSIDYVAGSLAYLHGIGCLLYLSTLYTAPTKVINHPIKQFELNAYAYQHLI